MAKKGANRFSPEAATRILERTAASPGVDAVGLSRRVPEGAGAWISAGLCEPEHLW